MNLGSLFISLGFKVNNQQLVALERQLARITAAAKAMGTAVTKAAQAKIEPVARSKPFQEVKDEVDAVTKAAKIPKAGPAIQEVKTLREAIGEASEFWSKRAFTSHTWRDFRVATVEAVALAAAVNLVNYALLETINLARKVGSEFTKFRVATGLDPRELKQWQFAAAAVGVSGKEIQDSITGIQSAQARISLGEETPSAGWGVLGINPGTEHNPFRILDAIRKRAAELPPDIARVLAAQMGISDNMFQGLLRLNKEWGKLAEQFVLTDAETDRLTRLNTAWDQLGFLLNSFRDKFAVIFAVPLTWIIKGLEKVVGWMALFVSWLNKGTLAATIIRWALIALASGVTIFGTALAILVGFVTTALFALMALALFVGAPGIIMAGWAAIVTMTTAVVGVLTMAINALAAQIVILSLTLLPLLPEFLVAAAIIGTLAFLIQDVITAARGGESVLGEFFKAFSAPVDALAAAMELIIGLVDSITGKFDKAKEHFHEMVKDIKSVFGFSGTGGAPWHDVLPNLAARAVDHPSMMRGGGGRSQSNHVEVHVHGGMTNEETGQHVARAVGRVLDSRVGDAFYQQPAAGF